MSYKLLEPAKCLDLVAFEASRALGLDDTHPFAGDAAVAAGKQTFLRRLRHTRSVDVEAKMRRGRGLVDVLTARALSADGAELDLGFRDSVRHWCGFESCSLTFELSRERRQAA